MSEVKLYLMPVKPLNDSELYERCFSLADGKRQEKTERYKHRKDRNLSLGAGILLGHALKERGYCLNDVMIEYGKYGKPYVKNIGDLYFNISHSGGYVMLAVSDREVGCDIEKIRKMDLSVAERFFHKHEYEALLDCDEDKRDELFMRYWTLKESCMKENGMGLIMNPSSFETVLSEPVKALKEGIEEDLYLGCYSDIPGYIYALCIRGKDVSVTKEIINIKDVII